MDIKSRVDIVTGFLVHSNMRIKAFNIINATYWKHYY